MANLSIVDEPPEYIVERELAKISLEARTLTISQDYIKLAEITIEHSSSTSIISSVRESGVKYYIPITAHEARRREYSAWFSDAPEAHESRLERADTQAAPYVMPHEPIYATGVCEIPLGVDDKKGEIYYSGEVVHGLGSGDVHVSVGFEYLATDEKLGKPAKNTIYGNPALFEDRESVVPQAELAVRVMGERGSFIVASRLKKNTNAVVLLVRWTAVKLPTGEERNMLTQLASDASISPIQPTIVVALNESRFIDVRFKNMAPCALEYELTEKNSGTITSDGIYTASNKEGVHEIHIYSAENPFISTYVYVVVKKDEGENKEKGGDRDKGKA
jgi:hypothetical protein